MRRINFIGAVGMAAMLAVLMLTGCKKENTTISGITINSTAETLEIGSTVTLSYTYEPSDATVKDAIWSSSNQAVATVDQNGVVAAVAAGTANITVTVNEQKTATCAVTVLPQMTGITISSEAKTIKIDSTFTLTYTVEPAEAKVESAVWSSSAETVATVDQNGVVKGIAEGTATITITVNGKFTKTCAVTVEKSAPIYTEGSYSGEGIKIGDVWWAPVNCGYDATHTYGSLYQWGRKYGQYYEAGTLALTDMNKSDDTETNKDNFGKYNTTDNNWFSGGVDNTLWTENSKSTHDPCPEGWRVPTEAEFEALISQKVWGNCTVGTVEQSGYWFNGSSAASVGTGVFLPTAGFRSITDGKASSHERGSYWCSSVNGSDARGLNFLIGTTGDYYVYMDSDYRANGLSVRCVQE